MTYNDLLQDVSDTLDRDDVAERLPRWIRLVEARVNRLLDDPAMEVSLPLTGDGADLPDDLLAIVSIGTADGNPLRPMGDVEYASLRPSSGVPRFYTVREGKVYYTPGSANVTLVYRKQVPPLSSNNVSNWLLSRAPDVYLFGVAAEAEAWNGNAEAAAGWLSRFEQALGELRADGARRKWGAGPLAPRIKRP